MDLKVGEQFVSILVPGEKRFLDVRRACKSSLDWEREGGREM